MTTLGRYCVANAVSRATLSELLTREDFAGLLRAGSVEEAWRALTKTAYGAWLPADIRPDPTLAEKLLRDTTAMRFRVVLKTLGGASRKVAGLLAARWELDALELALRLWHGGDRTAAWLFAQTPGTPGLPFDDVLGAHTIEEVVAALQKSPYAPALSAAVSAYKDKQSLLPVEVALERDYYGRLVKAISALRGDDARAGLQAISAEMDLVNLGWLSRLVRYYDVRTSQFSEYALPSPVGVSRRLAGRDLTPELFDEVARSVLGWGGFGDTTAMTEVDRIALFERLVSAAAAGTAHRVLAGYPFRITCVVSLYLLKRLELRNLTMVFAAKACGLDEAAIAPRLLGLE